MTGIDQKASSILTHALIQPTEKHVEFITVACGDDTDLMKMALDWYACMYKLLKMGPKLRSKMVSGLFSRAERLILILHYYELMTFTEIGTTLDLSQEEISKMDASILDRLFAPDSDEEHEASTTPQ